MAFKKVVKKKAAILPEHGTKVGNLKATSAAEMYMSRFKTRESMDVPFWLTTNNVMLDCAISGGLGIPCGHMICFVGEEGSGKTVGGIMPMPIVQGLGGFVMVQDTERRHKRDTYDKIGVDTDESHGQFKLHQPYTLDEALQNISEFCQDLLKFPAQPNEPPHYIFTDSIAALPVARVVTKREVKKGKLIETTEPMSVPVLFNEWLRQPEIRACKYRNVYFVWTNQVRDFVDFSATGGFKKKEYNLPGGRALRHALSVKIEVSKGAITDDLTSSESDAIISGFPVGEKHLYKVSRTTCGPPNRSAYLDWFYHSGPDEIRGMFRWLYRNSTTQFPFIKNMGAGKYSMWDQSYTQEEWINHIYASQDLRTYFKSFFIQCYNTLSNYVGNAKFGIEDDAEKDPNSLEYSQV